MGGMDCKVCRKLEKEGFMRTGATIKDIRRGDGDRARLYKMCPINGRETDKSTNGQWSIITNTLRPVVFAIYSVSIVSVVTF